MVDELERAFGAELPGSPRLRTVLLRLLCGDSEKQVASTLGLSPNTIHVYVKAIYQRYRVASRGELLARFLRSAVVGPVIVPRPKVAPRLVFGRPRRRAILVRTHYPVVPGGHVR